MLKAYLYIRVSTDEQAVKGYSQRSQAERLCNYCNQNNLEIGEKIFEDYSAKTFHRPEWDMLYAKLKMHKHEQVILLFTHWDRFSRNITDAYNMIEKLKKLGINTQAIEQPIDLSIPESKIMLAMYLATSEVENDRRSINVRLGLRRARLEGKWTAKAPIGYRNMTTPIGQKYIAPYEPEASILQTAFQTISHQDTSVGAVYHQSVLLGLKCSKSHFYELLKNPIYCGKIIIPAFQSEKAHLVNGNHEKLVTATLFDQVQKILCQKSYKLRCNKEMSDDLILRGIMLCPNCGKVLTGSASKGRSKWYYYYHCSQGCSFRVRADEVNNGFVLLIKELVAQEPFLVLCNKLVKNILGLKRKENEMKHTQLSAEATKLIDRAVNAQYLFTKGMIDYDDYILIKDNCKLSLNNYTTRILKLDADTAAKIFDTKQTPLLNSIGILYDRSDISIKKRIVYMIFKRRAILNPSNLETMFSEPVKIIFGLKKDDSVKTSQLKGLNFSVRENDAEIAQFINKLVLLAFEVHFPDN